MAKTRRVYGAKPFRVRQIEQVRMGRAYWSLEWYGICKHRGHRYYFPLGYEKKEALEKWTHILMKIKSKQFLFEEILEEHKRGYVLQKAEKPDKRPKKISTLDITIGDHLNFVWANKASFDMKLKTLQDYEACLIRLVGVGMAQREGSDDPTAVISKHAKERIRRKPLSRLSLLLVESYKQSALDVADEEGRSEKSAKRSANSYIRQAKALFSKKIRNLAKASGIKLPDLTDFLDSNGYSGVKVRYQLPNDALIKKTFEHLADPGKAPPRDVYVAILLALFAGARKSEVIRARPAWLTEANKKPGIDLKETKNGLPRFVPLPSRVFSWLRRNTPPENAYFIQGTKTYRTADVYKAANAWLRGLGWDRGKHFHELRKLFGSMIATTEGMEKAKNLLDHESIRTTEEHYANTTMGPGIVALWENFNPVRSTSKLGCRESKSA